jgi:hypothetical protein
VSGCLPQPRWKAIDPVPAQVVAHHRPSASTGRITKGTP